MSLQVEKLEGNMAKLTIEASAEEFEQAIEKAYQKEKSKISVPGFRKGKVPRQMIEKMYGKEVFYEGAANNLIPSAYAKAVDECEEEIVSQPVIDVVQAEAGKPFIFTAEVALKPEVKLGTYKGIKVEKADLTVTDEEVDAKINEERESNARTITVEDRAVKDGDMTVIDFEGFVDGVAFEGGKGENYPLTIGSGSFIPGFEEQLVGAELNKEVEVNVTFPEDYHAADLAGKAAVFKCTVKEIKKKEIDAKNEKEDKVIDAIIEGAEMVIPEAMIQTQQRQMADDFAQRLQMQGLSIDQYFQFTGLTREKFLEQMKPQAEKRIKTRLVLEAVAEAEKIDVTEEEYKAELQKMADAYSMKLEEMEDMIGAFEQKAIKSDLKIRKAVDFVVAQAKEKK